MDEVNKTILYETEIERGLNVVTVPLRWQLDKPLKIIMFETDNYYDETGPRLFYVDEVSMLCTGRERKDTATEPRADGMRLDDIEMLWHEFRQTEPDGRMFGAWKRQSENRNTGRREVPFSRAGTPGIYRQRQRRLYKIHTYKF